MSDSWSFYIYDGGEKGAKINISNSIFKHSQFSKGLIVYRKQPYIKEGSGFTNKTYLYISETYSYLSVPYVIDVGSYIYLEDSYFYNLNFMTNVTALAIYGGAEVKTTMYDYLGTTDITY